MDEQLHNQEIEEQYYKEHPESPLNRKGMEFIDFEIKEYER